MNSTLGTVLATIIAESVLDQMLPWIVGAGVFLLVLIVFRLLRPNEAPERFDPWGDEGDIGRSADQQATTRALLVGSDGRFLSRVPTGDRSQCRSIVLQSRNLQSFLRQRIDS